MKFLIIGLGSMGQRRIRLLLKRFERECLCGADISTKKRMQIENLFGIKTYSDYEVAISRAPRCCPCLHVAAESRRDYLSVYCAWPACF
ncbi:MAG: hypothetical protein VB035_11830 [Candidatus Fimivivens sp.]|nr:hypothetical protein [Candidatus Fimivivens sp.]